MDLANAEVGEAILGKSRGSVKRWSALVIRGPRACSMLHASPGMGLRGAGAGVHTG
jgi:hypothetical protein